MVKSQFQSNIYTITVTDKPVLTQDSSPVHDSAQPSISTPVQQEGTAAQILQVSAEVYVVPEPEHDATDVSEGPVGALSRMSLGTQVLGTQLLTVSPEGPVPVSTAEYRG